MHPTHFRYWAFISYSHGDEEFAAWLHRRLETFVVPADLVGKPHPLGEVPGRLFPVFRDLDELPGSSNLGAKIEEALVSSRYLIVVCSTRSARSHWVNKEILLFKSKGGGNRVLPIMIDGAPRVSAGIESEGDECFAPALRHKVDEEQRILDLPDEPIAADARKDSPGRDRAFLKVVAGLLEVGFDDLFQRETRRRVRERRWRVSVVLASILLLGATYVGMADAGVNLPGSDGVRRWLDHNGLVWIRRPRSGAEIVSRAAEMRTELIRHAEGRDEKDLLVYHSAAAGSSAEIDPWSSAQLATGIVACEESQGGPRTIISQNLVRLQQPDCLVVEGGKPVGWRYTRLDPPVGTIAAWMVNANCRLADVSPGESATEAVERFHLAWEAAQRYRTPGRTGWNLYATPRDPEIQNTYVSILMLEALAAAKASGVAIAGTSEFDQLIRDSATFLIDCFHAEGPNPGWRRSNTDHDPATFDGMTLQGYAALLHAERVSDFEIPARVFAEMTRKLVSCGKREMSYEITTAEFEEVYLADGREQRNPESVRFLWYPWAIRASALWLAGERPESITPEDRLAVSRTLSRLICDLGDEGIRDTLSLPPHATGELLYGLSAVTPSVFSNRWDAANQAPIAE